MTKRELDWAHEAEVVLHSAGGALLALKPDVAKLADALRSAYRRGMEEAAEIADAWERVRKIVDPCDPDAEAMTEQARGAWFVAKRIRAAIKNEEQPQEPPT